MKEHQKRIKELQEQVEESSSCKAKGGGTKSALSNGANVDLSQLSAVLEYDPQEYTLTALAGTSLKEIEALLDSNGQYMPFDPVLVDAGATLGGTIASGLSGSGRYRYGGIRDFLLGIRFVTGKGALQTGGGKVIKNASGFDLPKLMVGALGRFGIMTEATIKVFPKPECFTTMIFDFGSLSQALESLKNLATSSFELSCLDVDANGKLYLRFGGLKEAVTARKERLEAFLKQESKVLENDEDDTFWKEVREFAWADETSELVKVPLTLSRILPLDEMLPQASLRRYCVGGNVAYISLGNEQELANIETKLEAQSLPGLIFKGKNKQIHIGKQIDQRLIERLLKVFDSDAKFAIL